MVCRVVDKPLLRAARKAFRTFLITGLCAALVSWADGPKRPNLLAPSSPVLKLFKGHGTVLLEYDKPAGVALPSARVSNISDTFGKSWSGADTFRCTWDPASVPENEHRYVQLKIETKRTLPALNTVATIIFSGKDEDWTQALQIQSAEVAASERLKRVGSDAITLPFFDGGGETLVTFTKAPGAEKPAVQISAPNERGISFPPNAIESAWEGKWPEWNKAGSVTLRLSVKQGIQLPEFQNAAGKIILKWTDGEQAMWPFTVSESSARTFNIKKTDLTVDVRGGQKIVAPIEIENAGTAPLTAVNIKPAVFSDSDTGRYVEVPAFESNDRVRQNALQTLAVPLVSPRFAGAYKGVLYVSANGSPAKAVNVTLRTRGPFGGLALLFFALTIIGGYVISRVLTQWIKEGGAERNQALIKIYQNVLKLKACEEKLSDSPLASILPKTIQAIKLARFSFGEASELQARPLTELQEIQRKSGALVDSCDVLFDSIQWVEENQPGQADQFIAQFDQFNLNSATYATELTNVLEGAKHTRSTLRHGPARDLPERVLVLKQREKTQQEKEQKTKEALRWVTVQHFFMGSLNWVTTIVVVFGTAYITIFYANPTYGKFLDYIQTFFYALGLSAAGTEILGKASSSYNKPH